jgi:CheY-like chemotaxis protein
MSAPEAAKNANKPPLFLVCEDGHEYIQRFERFLGREFRFLRVGSGAEAQAALALEPITGLLLDLDFRRLHASQLLGESGPPASSPTTEERGRWSAMQGILILQHLRRQGIRLAALLFADLDDAEQSAYLEKTLAPLAVVSSREGLAQLAARLRLMLA